MEAPADAGQPDTFDRSTLDQMSRSQRSGAPRIVAALIDSYFADAARSIETLVQASEHADATALAHAAHALGLGSDFVGARKLAHMCRDLERAGLAGQTQNLERQIAGIRQEYKAVQLAMEAVRTGGEATSRSA
jgi:HPt (histidine-containing phosphotransfer) domain-containing protein